MNNEYDKKINEFMKSDNMFIIEMTKCCNYNAFIFIYKDETLMDLYNKVYHQFLVNSVNNIFFYTHDSQKISLPITSKKKMRDFILENITCNPAKLKPIYPQPLPVVYRFYFEDDQCCKNAHSHYKNILV